MCFKCKDYGKEMLIAAVLYIILSVGFDFIAEFLMGEPTKEVVFSPFTMIFGTVFLFLPLIATLPSGYLIKKKNGSLKDSIIYSGIALGIGTLILMLFSVGMMFTLTDEQWVEELVMVEELGIDFFSEMSLDEFKEFTISTTVVGAVVMALINFGLGIVGGLIGSVLYRGKVK